MKSKMQLLVATKNLGKVKELKRLLAELPLHLRSLNEFPDVIEAEETGATFAENAALKAQYYALQTGIWALADDSGLEVEALSGAPGVFSARYAGANASDAEKIEKLLDELNKKQAAANRRAQFTCAMAISDARGEIKYTAEEICAGRMALSPKGSNGFGYDAVFIPEGFDETFGELSGETKQKISHRARAAKKIILYLRYITAISLDRQTFRL